MVIIIDTSTNEVVQTLEGIEQDSEVINQFNCFYVHEKDFIEDNTIAFNKMYDKDNHKVYYRTDLLSETIKEPTLTLDSLAAQVAAMNNVLIDLSLRG